LAGVTTNLTTAKLLHDHAHCAILSTTIIKSYNSAVNTEIGPHISTG